MLPNVLATGHMWQFELKFKITVKFSILCQLSLAPATSQVLSGHVAMLPYWTGKTLSLACLQEGLQDKDGLECMPLAGKDAQLCRSQLRDQWLK
jgi:hypothetical protein